MIVIARLEALAALADTAQIRLHIGKDVEMACEVLEIIGDQLDAAVEKLKTDAREQAGAAAEAVEATK